MTAVTVKSGPAQKALNQVLIETDGTTLRKAIGLRLLKAIDDNFRKEGGEFNKPWKKLDPRTIKQRRGVSARILQDTGNLKNSYTMRLQGGETVAVGTNKEYAPAHEFGMPERGIPERKMLPSEKTAQLIATKLINARLRRISGRG